MEHASAEADVRAIVAATERFQDDPDSFAALLTNDAILVNAVGRRVIGRQAIRDAMRQALKTPLANVRTRHEVLEVRFLAPTVAVAEGTKHVSGEGSPHANSGSTVAFSFVMVGRDDQWRIAVAHNTLVRT